VKTTISNDQFTQIVTGGTALNQTWRQRMAAVVPYLKQLKDAGVPMLFRPFHEMNETWNWWGGRPGANGGSKIFQQMRDYFDAQGLDNLIWGNSQTRWSYFMMWSEQLRANNTNAQIQSTYFNGRVLNQGEVALG